MPPQGRRRDIRGDVQQVGADQAAPLSQLLAEPVAHEGGRHVHHAEGKGQKEVAYVAEAQFLVAEEGHAPGGEDRRQVRQKRDDQQGN